MRCILLAVGSCLLLACGVLASRAQRPPQQSSRLDELAWLTGAWARTDAPETTEEHWIEPKGGLMLGCGRTIARGKAIAFEFLRIEQRGDGKLYYVAQPSGRSPGAEFELTGARDGAWTFENPAHDFPRLIRYSREGEACFVAHLEGLEQGRATVLDLRFERPAR